MIPLEEAQRQVIAGVPVLEPVRYPLIGALGAVLADDVVSGESVPPFANTAMDGFAVVASDTAGASPAAPARLEVIATVAAGSAADVDVVPGTAARIMTGAPMPRGADAVVMVERARTIAAGGDGTGEIVEVEVEVAPGEHVRGVGGDIVAGATVFPRGTRLTAGHLGVLASIGLGSVLCVARPRVGVLSTGDELVGPGEPLRPGQIRDSNRPSLLGLLLQSGLQPTDLGVVADDEAAIEAALTAEGVDAVITTGGVSMGDFDYVKAVLQRLAPDSSSWMQVAIRPAKPLSFAVLAGRPVFGLPGNPVSCMVSFELFARPALRRMAGFGDDELRRAPVVAVAPEGFPRRPDGKTHFVRVSVGFDRAAKHYVARPLSGQGSHMLRTMARANALAIVPDGEGIAPGGDVDVLLLD